MNKRARAEEPEDTDVIIVGAGPAGLMLACELALRSIRCIVLERRPDRPSAAGGMLLPARSAQLLRLRELSDRLKLDQAPVWPRTHFAFLYLDTAQHSPDSVELVVPQWQLDSMLADRAAELGAQLRTGTVMTALDQDEDLVRIEFFDETSPSPQRLSASFLVGCDGADSRTAELAGFDYETHTPQYYGLIGDFVADERYRRFEAGNFPGGQFGVLPVNPADPSEIRLMTMENGRAGPASSVPVTLDELTAAIGRITGQSITLDQPRWLLRYGSENRSARELRRNRVLLAGDAAHAHPPSAGNGLNTAIQDATNLGFKLAWTIRGHGGPELLDSYEHERLPVARRVCVRAAAQLPAMEPQAVAAPLREILTDLLQHVPEAARRLIEFATEIRYPVAIPANADPEQAELLGQPIPFALAPSLPDGRGALLRLACPGSSEPAPVDHEAESGALRPWTDRIAVLDLPAAGWPPGRYLIRPDGYLVWADRFGGQPAATLAADALLLWFGSPRAD